MPHAEVPTFRAPLARSCLVTFLQIIVVTIWLAAGCSWRHAYQRRREANHLVLALSIALFALLTRGGQLTRLCVLDLALKIFDLLLQPADLGVLP